MKNLTDKTFRIIIGNGKDGILQSKLWKKLDLSSSNGSRLTMQLEKRSLIKRERGWLQVASKEIGHHGKLIGIDLQEVKPIEGAIILHDNIEDHMIVDRILGLMNCKADVVLSDVAPNISGIWELDHAKQILLARRAFDVAAKVLRRGGIAIFKVFEGELLNEFKMELKYNFDRVLLSKPEASRQKSSELYLVCLKFKGQKL